MTNDELGRLAAKLEAIGYTPEDAVFLVSATMGALRPPEEKTKPETGKEG